MGGGGEFSNNSLVLAVLSFAPAARQYSFSIAAIIAVQSATEWAYTTTSSAY